MSAYKHIFFDLDHTLWDFYKNSEETLLELFGKYNLSAFGVFSPAELVQAYTVINDQMWKDYNLGLIGKDAIRNERFPRTFVSLGLAEQYHPAGFNEDYLRICPGKGHLIPHAVNVLSYLREKYTLHIITNGFSETQVVKLSTSGISDYFANVINSESCGHLKPDIRIFNHAIQLTGSCCEDCIMIGDDLYADVLGAREAGVDQVFFNRHKIAHNEKITFEIDCLSELMTLL